MSEQRSRSEVAHAVLDLAQPVKLRLKLSFDHNGGLMNVIGVLT